MGCSRDISWAHLKSLDPEKHTEERGELRACVGMDNALIIELKTFGIVVCAQANESSSDRDGDEQRYCQCHGD